MDLKIFNQVEFCVLIIKIYQAFSLHLIFQINYDLAESSAQDHHGVSSQLSKYYLLASEIW